MSPDEYLEICAGIDFSDRESVESQFESLALQAFEFHREHNPVYRAFCESRPNLDVSSWEDIPCLPISMFKHVDVKWTDTGNSTVFYSSGTTQSQKSRHVMNTTWFYEQSLIAGFREYMPVNPSRTTYVALSPELPDSSLYFMMKKLTVLGFEDVLFWDQFSPAGMDELRRYLDGAESVFFFGTSLAMWEMVQNFGKDAFPRRPMSVALETGGPKNKQGEIADPRVISHEFCKNWGVRYPQRHYREYGMSELSSQLYGYDEPGGKTLYTSPGWMRTRIVNPLTQEDEEGGVIAFYDLANVWSCPFILSEDVGRHEGHHLELLGRATGAVEKGCSLTLQEALEAQEK